MGGVNLDLHQAKFDLNSAGGSFSRDGVCRSFGKGANGYVSGEGVGAILLKRLDQAIADPRTNTRPSKSRRAVRYTAAYSAWGAPSEAGITFASTSVRPDGCAMRIAVASGARALAHLAGIGVGLLLLIASSRLLVWGAVEIARGLGVSDLIIGLTVVAAGTSLPELASSIIAARKGEHDIALGNVLGSNLFNTLSVVGIAALRESSDSSVRSPRDLAELLRGRPLRGLRPVIVAENRPEWLIADLAVMAAGGVTVPAYITTAAGDHAYILRDPDLELLLAAAQQTLTSPATSGRYWVVETVQGVAREVGPANAPYTVDVTLGAETRRTTFEVNAPPED